MTTSEKEGGHSAFKRTQLRHKRQSAAPNRMDDLNEFCDFCNPDQNTRIHRINMIEDNSLSEDLYQGPVFGIQGFSGFLYAPQALSPSLQQKLSYLAVSEFCQSPHATNIDLVPPKLSEQMNEEESMWNLWKRENSCDITNKSNNKCTKVYRSFKKLSWATMGYQYDWTRRAYHEGSKSVMPECLVKLSICFAKTSLRIAKAQSTSFTASAAIVNYYNEKSIMGGHRDDLELALDKPVISFSMGMPAIFLLGGKTKHQTPIVPILVRPGDVMILGGDSRLNYHGMARTIPPSAMLPSIESTLSKSLPSVQFTLKGKDILIPQSDLEPLGNFLQTHRININVRQVLPDDVSSMSKS